MREVAINIASKNVLILKELEADYNEDKIFFGDSEYVIKLDNNLPKELFSNCKDENKKTLLCLPFKVLNDQDYICFENYNCESFVVTNKDNNVIGIITSKEIVMYLLKAVKLLETELDLVKTDLDAIMTYSNDLTCITDSSGSKVRISSLCERFYGVKPEILIGKNVKDLEKNGTYLPSATRMVIEGKKPVITTQKTKIGHKLLVTATPVFDNMGNIKRVVSISKDITDEEKLKAELKLTKTLIQRYESELAIIRETSIKSPVIIYRNKGMEKLIEMANKVASVESSLFPLYQLFFSGSNFPDRKNHLPCFIFAV